MFRGYLQEWVVLESDTESRVVLAFRLSKMLFPFGDGFLDSTKIGPELWTILIPHGELCLPTAIAICIKDILLPTNPTYVCKSLNSRSLEVCCIFLRPCLLGLSEAEAVIFRQCLVLISMNIPGWSSWQEVLFLFTFFLNGNLVEILFSHVSC